ncbi:ABC transporter ATP-binding protein [Sphaerisporangium sp. NPDC051017]|uniref:ABC transporter ATP-binding protein n=1 Tax=Sphaerisporangium sp. NPDC051017 TaxID=3154636 RepID=UPI003417E40E
MNNHETGKAPLDARDTHEPRDTRHEDGPRSASYERDSRARSEGRDERHVPDRPGAREADAVAFTGEPVATTGAAFTGQPLVVVEGLRKVYRTGPKEVVALRDVSFEAYPGQLVAIRGRSGSGKTTLLNQIGGLDRPDAGRVLVDGHVVTELAEAGLLELRRDVIGFIFQSFGLIPVLSAAENVGVPMRLTRTPAGEREERIHMLLAMVGLEKHVNQRPYELSGGQQQRVAVARALANRPRLLIADEPTGQLDSGTGRQIMELIRAVVRSEGVTALVATHDPNLISLADTVLELHDGTLTTTTTQPTPTAA